MSGARILVVDDEPSMLRSIRLILSGHGYDVAVARDGESGLAEFARRLPDLVLLDLMLPDISGLDVCRTIRERSNVAIVVLSARGEEAVKVEAFDLGADDYLTKPFGSAELLARVRVALKHSAGMPDNVFRTGKLTVDVVQRRVTLGGEVVSLTPREYDVLKFLATHHDRVVTHSMILQQIWGPDYAAEAQYLRHVVLSLRKKLERDPSHPELILTEPGIGYRVQSND